MEEKRKLSLVPFSGVDFSLGKHVSEPGGTLSTEHSEISAKLSLYFQWKQEAFCFLILPKRRAIPCRLDVDPDEKEPTELYCVLDDTSLKVAGLKKIKIRLELFRVCYEFEASVSANYSSPENLTIVAEIPNAIKTYKSRKLPRVKVLNEHKKNIPAISWKALNGISVERLFPLELGLASCVLGGVSVDPGTRGTIQFGDLQIAAESIRSEPEKSVFSITLDSPSAYGAYFDIYRTVAFPNLIPRHTVPMEKRWQLYVDTGYFKGFLGDSDSPTQNEIMDVWSEVDKVQHVNSADYMTVESERLCGASSTTKCFFDNKYEYWAFQQLCSLTDPSLLDCTGQLYTWRAEYLSGKAEKIKTVFWYRSKSRWLERIYAKFINSAEEGSLLEAVQLVTGNISAGKNDILGDKEFDLSYGSFNRFTAWYEGANIIAGGQPELLNAARILNIAFPLKSSAIPSETLVQSARRIVNKSGRSQSRFFLSLQLEDPLPEGFKPFPSDRYCLIEKKHLVDFLSSVEHSISVTQRKIVNERK